MSTLAQVTKETRILFKISAAAAVLAIVLFIVFKGGAFVKSVFFPAPVAPPDQKFGELPHINFPKSNDTIPTFSINTVSGSLPAFPDRIKVYQLKKNPITITALSNAKSKVGNVGYTANQQMVSSTLYKWSKPQENNVISYDTVSANFSIDSDFATNASFTASSISSDDNLLKIVTDFIDTVGADKSDIDFGNIHTSYFNIINTNLTPTDGPTAQVIRFDLYQNQVDKLQIYYPVFNNSLLNFMIAGNGAPEIVSARYNHFTPDLTTSATYPMKSASAAYDDLQNGKGFIVSPTSDKNVEITDVTLGYYLGPDEDQKYLLPIIVFTGKNNFMAYTEAIAY